MSLIATLYPEDMECTCPACGERCEVEPDDVIDMIDGKPEYSIMCPDCGTIFYVHEDY